MTQPGQLRCPDVAPYGLVVLRLAGEFDAIKTAVHDGSSPFLPVNMRVRTRPDLCARSHPTGRTMAGKVFVACEPLHPRLTANAGLGSVLMPRTFHGDRT